MNPAEFILWLVPIGIPFFVISSIVLYIKNRIEAKTEGREIKRIYEKMFTISLAIIILFGGGFLALTIYSYHSPWIQEAYSSGDTQVANSVHTAILTAMMDPEITNREDYDEDLNALTTEFDITQYTGDENCILAGAAKILGVEDLHTLSGQIRSRGATGRILVTVRGPKEVWVVVEGTKSWVDGEVITIR